MAALSKVNAVVDGVVLMLRGDEENARSLFTTSGRAARECRYQAGISMNRIDIGVTGFPVRGPATRAVASSGHGDPTASTSSRTAAW